MQEKSCINVQSVGRGLMSKEGIEKHKLQHGDKSEKLKCEHEGCKVTFSRKQSLKKLMKQFHGPGAGQKFECHFCKKEVSSKDNQKAHEMGCKDNPNRKELFCKTCGKGRILLTKVCYGTQKRHTWIYLNHHLCCHYIRLMSHHITIVFAHFVCK